MIETDKESLEEHEVIVIATYVISETPLNMCLTRI